MDSPALSSLRIGRIPRGHYMSPRVHAPVEGRSRVDLSTHILYILWQRRTSRPASVTPRSAYAPLSRPFRAVRFWRSAGVGGGGKDEKRHRILPCFLLYGHEIKDPERREYVRLWGRYRTLLPSSNGPCALETVNSSFSTFLLLLNCSFWSFCIPLTLVFKLCTLSVVSDSQPCLFEIRFYFVQQVTKKALYVQFRSMEWFCQEQ